MPDSSKLRRLPIALPILAGLTLVTAAFARTSAPQEDAAPSSPLSPGPTKRDMNLHRQEVMKSSFCADCHPAIYAEHEMNTHGRAFTDPEVRLATGRFSQGDCIICHTPRPIFETGNGQNPQRRHYGLAEGNTCMTCHWKPEYEYGTFQGGAECRGAFDPRVGEVEACAACHKNHGTPYQWALAPTGAGQDMLCMDCHMETVTRPVAVGEEPKLVRSHAFPGSRSEKQLRAAYAYEASIDGDHVLVRVRNRGAGHNFPTELKQRSVESLIVVRDAMGQEIARSRKVFRDPYKRPYGLYLPVNTQIPAGETREHRVPIQVASGTIECQLFYKRYFPIEDSHPDLSRRLEVRHMAFSGVVPSQESIESTRDVVVVTPESIQPELASPANLVDFARPPIGGTEVIVPDGNSPEDIAGLIELFQFPVPQANKEAQARLKDIGEPAVPALVSALGSWDNKTWKQAANVLVGIGEAAVPVVVDGLSSDELYVRIHTSKLLSLLPLDEDQRALVAERLGANLERSGALDRAAAANAIGVLKLHAFIPELTALLEDGDPDVVRDAALALAVLGNRSSVDAMRAALDNFIWEETRRDLARALASLGDPSGIPLLIEGLTIEDDLVRESMFEALHAVTGRHFGYEAFAPYDERLSAISRWRNFWSEKGGADAIRTPPPIDPARSRRAHKLVSLLGGTDGTVAPGDDIELRAELVELADDAVPALAGMGLKYPPGFAAKRALTCDVLGEIGSREAVPALITALRDAWAASATARPGRLRRRLGRPRPGPHRRSQRPRRRQTPRSAAAFPRRARQPASRVGLGRRPLGPIRRHALGVGRRTCDRRFGRHAAVE